MKLVGVILLFTIATGAVAELFDMSGHTSRLLLATSSDSIFNQGSTSEQASVYQVASSTYGGLYTLGTPSGWTVSNLTATLELDTAATYANNFNIDRPGTWQPGTTRFNVTVQFTQGGGATSSNYSPPSVAVQLHTATCEKGVFDSNMLEQTKNGTTNLAPALAIGEDLTATNGVAFNSTIISFLVDYDLAKSIAVVSNGMYMSCRDLVPPFPDFPNDWSATIETNDVYRGFTFVMQQTYSQSLNMLRLDLHSFATDRIIVSNISTNAITMITPANGSCQAQNFGRGFNWFVNNDTNTLLDTAEMLHFTASEDIQYSPGFVDVRGIPCEVWKTYVDVQEDRFNASFDVEYYFPVNEWLVAREDYHRMLKRVYMNGTANGHPMEVYHEFVNFRPRTLYPSLFEICAISPYGSNCNCTDALRKKAFVNGTQTLSQDSGDGLSVTQSYTTLGCPNVPHGFISAQSGPYVGLTIIGMVAGSMITGAAMYLFYRKRVGVRITDGIGHQRFQDGA